MGYPKAVAAHQFPPQLLHELSQRRWKDKVLADWLYLLKPSRERFRHLWVLEKTKGYLVLKVARVQVRLLNTRTVYKFDPRRVKYTVKVTPVDDKPKRVSRLKALPHLWPSL